MTLRPELDDRPNRRAQSAADDDHADPERPGPIARLRGVPVSPVTVPAVTDMAGHAAMCALVRALARAAAREMFTAQALDRAPRALVRVEGTAE